MFFLNEFSFLSSNLPTYMSQNLNNGILTVFVLVFIYHKPSYTYDKLIYWYCPSYTLTNSLILDIQCKIY